MSASRIIFAVDFAAKAHGTQKRKNALGFPYIVHPIGVAKILSEEAHVDDIVVLEAALLHGSTVFLVFLRSESFIYVLHPSRHCGRYSSYAARD